MTTIQTLNKVVEIAEKRRDEALGALGQMQRELQIAQDQMDQLQAYAQEAEQRWAVRSATGVDGALLMHHRQFMAKIQPKAQQRTRCNRHCQPMQPVSLKHARPAEHRWVHC